MRKLILRNIDRKYSIFFRTTGENPRKLWFDDRRGLYLTKVDLENLEFVKTTDKDYPAVNLPTINDLIADGRLEGEFAPYREYRLEVPGFESCRKWDDVGEEPEPPYKEIIAEFARNGFRVSKAALEHNFFAWINDAKSGYRGRNYHLFTPCGCNRLSFCATELYPACRDWQQTYFA